jgi:hypothetical protein
MGPGGLRAAALVISECQAGILDPAMSTTPALAAQAAERGIVDRIVGLAAGFRAYAEIPADCVAGTSAKSCEFMVGGLLPVVARITDSAALLAALAELSEGTDTR